MNKIVIELTPAEIAIIHKALLLLNAHSDQQDVAELLEEVEWLIPASNFYAVANSDD